MFARFGSIFKALYMALRVGLYLSSSLWGMPRDLSYDIFGVFCRPLSCLCVTPKGCYSDGFLFVCGHHHVGLLFLGYGGAGGPLYKGGKRSISNKSHFPRLWERGGADIRRQNGHKLGPRAFLYTFKYGQIHLNTFIYLHVPPYVKI